MPPMITINIDPMSPTTLAHDLCSSLSAIYATLGKRPGETIECTGMDGRRIAVRYDTFDSGDRQLASVTFYSGGHYASASYDTDTRTGTVYNSEGQEIEAQELLDKSIITIVEIVKQCVTTELVSQWHLRAVGSMRNLNSLAKFLARQ